MFTRCVGRFFDQLKFTRLGFLFTWNYLNRTKKSDVYQLKVPYERNVRSNFSAGRKFVRYSVASILCRHHSPILMGRERGVAITHFF